MPILTALPDCKAVHKDLTIGANYEFVREIGNGVEIVTDDPETRIILLRSRFDPVVESNDASN
jgi:hypothetical protein